MRDLKDQVFRVLAGSRIFFQVLAIFLRTFSDSAREGAPEQEHSAALICATISPSVLWTPLSEPKKRLPWKRWASALSATAIGARLEQVLKRVSSAAAWDRSPGIRAFLLFEQPALSVGVKVRLSLIPAPDAGVPARRWSAKKYPLKFPPGLTMDQGYV